MTNKERLIKLIESLPDDLQYFSSEGDYKDLDIRVFTEPKTDEFLDWYFFGI